MVTLSSLPLPATSPAKVITLSEVRSQYAPGRCQHRKILVDEALSEVECADCGAKLNPVATQARFAREESRWSREADRAHEEMERLNQRVRCKCLHCGKMTPILGR